MEFNRAQEIINSSEKIEVHHQGEAVWLVDLDNQTNTARVSQGPQFNAEKEVPISELREVGLMH